MEKNYFVKLSAIFFIVSFIVLACNNGSTDTGSDFDGTGGGGDTDGVSYTVTYNAMGATGTPPESLTVNNNSYINLHDGSGFSRTGCIFNGWYTFIAGTRTDYTAGASYCVTSDVIFYANWATACTIIFNINNGNGETPSPKTVISGTSITLPSAYGLSRTGFTFGGWNTNNAGTGTNYDSNSSYTVMSSVTLYARWDVIATGTWKTSALSNGATGGGGMLIGSSSTYTLTLSDYSTFLLEELYVSYKYTNNYSVYNETGRYTYTENGTYTVTGSIINLKNNSGTTVYTGTVSGNTMSLSARSGATFYKS